MTLRRTLIAALIAAAALPVAALSADVPDAERAEVTRAVGTVLGSALRSSLDDVNRLGVDVDRELLIATIIDVIDNRDTGFTRDQANQYVENYINRRYHGTADTVDAASQHAFVARAAARPGAVTTPSGLVFETIKEGHGDTPRIDQHVVINYRGTLADGTVFDETDEGPVTFDLVNLVPGFSEGLQMMRPGGSYRLTIPADLAYGRQGIGGFIPGNAALVFDVDLINIE